MRLGLPFFNKNNNTSQPSQPAFSGSKARDAHTQFGAHTVPWDVKKAYSDAANAGNKSAMNYWGAEWIRHERGDYSSSGGNDSYHASRSDDATSSRNTRSETRRRSRSPKRRSSSSKDKDNNGSSSKT